MKTLVYGAGDVGSLYAATLMDAGHDVTILGWRSDSTRARFTGIMSVPSPVTYGDNRCILSGPLMG